MEIYTYGYIYVCIYIYIYISLSLYIYIIYIYIDKDIDIDIYKLKSRLNYPTSTCMIHNGCKHGLPAELNIYIYWYETAEDKTKNLGMLKLY